MTDCDYENISALFSVALIYHYRYRFVNTLENITFLNEFKKILYLKKKVCRL